MQSPEAEWRLNIGGRVIQLNSSATILQWFRPRSTSPSPGSAKSSIALGEIARLSPDDALQRLGSAGAGLPAVEAAARLLAVGPNEVAHEAGHTVLGEILSRSINPLNVLLLTLAAASYFIGDARAAIVIAIMVFLSVSLGFFQEHRSTKAAEALRRMVQNKTTVRRLVAGTEHEQTDIPIGQVVPGDIVLLSAGDMIPADVRLISAKDLFINQSTLTGEAMPVEKHAHAHVSSAETPFDLPNICFMGSAVVSGVGCGVVVLTGSRTAFGQVASSIAEQRELTSFDKGVTRVTWMMLGLILIMVPLVFFINGLSKGDWFEALLFAVAVAVGLTPEMMPMIVTVNLAKGAMAMSKKRVIVKRLNAIQNFGAMDILCTDKTGTLTQDKIILKRHLDLRGEESERVLEYAYLNSFHQSGLKNLLDVAVLDHVDLKDKLKAEEHYRKIDEIPFDFERRRMSVVLERGDKVHILICKGAVEEVFAVCTRYAVNADDGALDESHFAEAKETTAKLNADGFRVIAVAYKEMPPEQAAYSVADETKLMLRKRCPARTLTAQAASALAYAHGISSSMRDCGQPFTSLVSVSVSQACGFTALSLQVSISEAMVAQLAPPSSLPANSAFFLLIAIARPFCPYRAGCRGPLSLASTLWTVCASHSERAACIRRVCPCRVDTGFRDGGAGVEARFRRLRRSPRRPTAGFAGSAHSVTRAAGGARIASPLCGRHSRH